MASLRRVGRACIAASAAPVVLLSCVDLGGLSDTADAGVDGAGTEAGAAPSEMKCPPGQKSCAGGCVAIDLPDYGCAATSCNRCGLPFADTQTCMAGACAVGTCQPGRGDCDNKNENGCEADLTTAATCGSCKVACPTSSPLCGAGQCAASCASNELQCGTQCVDVMVSPTHCGSCSTVCPSAMYASPACENAKCTVKCNTGFAICDAASGNGCEGLKPYYADGDGDGFGAGPKVGQACTAPAGTSLAAGDCLDSNSAVKPGQAGFFFTGYTNASGKISYDYDCNGSEEREPTKLVGPGCSACRAGDYTAVARANLAPNADFFCGSTTRVSGCGSIASCSLTSTSFALGCR